MNRFTALLDNSVFDRLLDVGFIYFITSSFAAGTEEAAETEPGSLLSAGFGKFISQMQSSE